MRRKVFRYSFLCALLFVFVTAVFMFTACGKEETVKEKEENKKENKKENKEEIVIKKDDIEDTEEVGSSDPELEEEAAFPILNDLIDRMLSNGCPDFHLPGNSFYFLYMQKIFLTERGHRSTAVRCQRQV
jgi:hypothetical protein